MKASAITIGSIEIPAKEERLAVFSATCDFLGVSNHAVFVGVLFDVIDDLISDSCGVLQLFADLADEFVFGVFRAEHLCNPLVVTVLFVPRLELEPIGLDMLGRSVCKRPLLDSHPILGRLIAFEYRAKPHEQCRLFGNRFGVRNSLHVLVFGRESLADESRPTTGALEDATQIGVHVDVIDSISLSKQCLFGSQRHARNVACEVENGIGIIQHGFLQ
ncbi:hypothetical protein C492_11220 [Natronococcus jeotgali DSM 18795]|uniref:Uncharacterized protein n=1 Tax=Natronococcus jeotgali DSM 18795 TaxID=1227498 RepID=L9XC42_9EURY|nr:hypothetical protein C492_11220 [Natronococcus jeotgali DSM 18795]